MLEREFQRGKINLIGTTKLLNRHSKQPYFRQFTYEGGKQMAREFQRGKINLVRNYKAPDLKSLSG